MSARARRLFPVLLLACVLLLPDARALAQATPVVTFEEVQLEGRHKLFYALVLPNGYDPEKAYPVLIALPPGAQTREMVQAGLSMYWETEARQRGWVVVSPQGPNDELFRTGDDSVMPVLFEDVLKHINVEGHRFHLAGVSNGGRAAFRIATQHPRDILSVTVLPGAPPEEEDWANLAALKDIDVTMFVGSRDRTWLRQTEKAAEELRLLGIEPDVRVIEGEHVVPVDPAELFTIFERSRTTKRPAPIDQPSPSELMVRAIGATLDAMHSAAEKLDVDAFLGSFAPDAVFIGTAPGERLSLQQLRDNDGSALAAGAGWPVEVVSRNVTLGSSQDVAWFDESLKSPLLGPLRATGVMAYDARDDAWRIRMYSIAMAVPAERLADVVATIGVADAPGPAPDPAPDAGATKPDATKPDDDADADYDGDTDADADDHDGEDGDDEPENESDDRPPGVPR